MIKKLIPILALLCFLAIPAHATTCGHTNVETNDDGGNNNTVRTGSCVPGANSTVTDCQVYQNTTGFGLSYNCGIYDSDGTAGAAKTLICQGTPGSLSTSMGWNVISLSGAGCGTLTSGHTYWVGINAAGGEHWVGVFSGTSYTQAQTCCSMSTLSASSSYGETFSLYLDITASGGGGVKRLRGAVVQSGLEIPYTWDQLVAFVKKAWLS